MGKDVIEGTLKEWGGMMLKEYNDRGRSRVFYRRKGEGSLQKQKKRTEIRVEFVE